MPRGACTFRLTDLTRALKGARAAGIDVARIKIAKDGSIEIDTGKTDKPDDAKADKATGDIVL